MWSPKWYTLMNVLTPISTLRYIYLIKHKTKGFYYIVHGAFTPYLYYCCEKSWMVEICWNNYAFPSRRGCFSPNFSRKLRYLYGHEFRPICANRNHFPRYSWPKGILSREVSLLAFLDFRWAATTWRWNAGTNMHMILLMITSTDTPNNTINQSHRRK